MWSSTVWAIAPLLLCGVVSGLEKRADCPTVATTTIFVPITVYASAPISIETTAEVDISTGNSEENSSMSTSTMECEDSGTTTSQAATGAGTSSIAADTSSVTSFRTSYLLQTDEPTTSTASTSVVLSAPTAVSSLEPIPTGPPGSFNGYKNAVYFTNWGTYGSNYQPQDLPVSELTHVLYAFADIDSDGTVKSSDTYADLEKHYPTDSWQDEGHNAYGVVKQLFLHKKNNRNLKTLLSIGGWTYSPKFAPVAASEAGRQTFASSATKLMVDYGFDGVDIDWEYPSTAVEAQDFVLLLQAVRTALDDYSAQYSLGYRFLITVATPAGPMNYDMMDLAGMDKYADAWNLMAYDYAGSRDSTTGHQSNLFKNDELPASTKYSTEDAVQYYESQGIASTKIVLGIPLYGRSFEATLGLGAPYNGVGTGGSQPGIWLYNSLPRQGAVENWDDVAKASWSYDSGTEELISYDTIKSSTVKAEYVLSRSLGGAFFWEASGDRSGDQSLINTVSQSLRWLDQTPNNLRYPTSQYDNIREGLL